MNQQERAKVVVSSSAARAIFDEVQRWVERGLADGGVPLESMLYPLSALVPRAASFRCPLELAGVEQMREVVIDGAAVPPDEIKAFSPHNCHFAGDDIDQASAAFNAAIDQALIERPRLAVNSKLHSHPFSGGAFLSSGDLRYGVSAPAALAWRERRGLDTALLHVVHPDGDPLPCPTRWDIDAGGALAAAPGQRSVRWRLHSWASVGPRTEDPPQMLDLGDATIVDDSYDAVAAARRLAYWQTTPGAAWCDAQKAALRSAGYKVSRNLLGRGWRRYLVEAGARTVLVALPPDFPHAPLRALEVRRAWANDFAPLVLPPGMAGGDGSRLGNCSLLKLARYLGAPTARQQQAPLAPAGEARPQAPTPPANA